MFFSPLGRVFIRERRLAVLSCLRVFVVPTVSCIWFRWPHTETACYFTFAEYKTVNALVCLTCTYRYESGSLRLNTRLPNRVHNPAADGNILGHCVVQKTIDRRDPNSILCIVDSDELVLLLHNNNVIIILATQCRRRRSKVVFSFIIASSMK